MKPIAILSLLITLIGCLRASEELLDRINNTSLDIIERFKLIDSLELSDVPLEWEPRKEISELEGFPRVTLWRGDTKVAEFFWREDKPATSNGGFIGKVVNEEEVVAYFTLTKGRMDAFTNPNLKNYSSIFSMTPSKEKMFTVIGDSGFFEIVIIDGRESHLVDRLEFAKAYYKHCLMEGVIDSIREISIETKQVNIF